MHEQSVVLYPQQITLKQLFLSIRWADLEPMIPELFPQMIKGKESLKDFKYALFQTYAIDPELWDGRSVIAMTPFANVYHLAVTDGKRDEALMFYPWRKLLGFYVDPVSIQRFGLKMLACLSLFEMTHNGFSAQAVDEALAELTKEEMIYEAADEIPPVYIPDCGPEGPEAEK
jgi:hypothetical protein